MYVTRTEYVATNAAEWMAAGAGTATVIVLIVTGFLIWRQLFAQAYQGLVDIEVRVDQLLMKDPELWPYFHDNEDLPEDTVMRTKAIVLAEMLVNLADAVANQKMRHPLPWKSKSTWESWQTYFESLYANSPAVREFWRRYHHWYPQGVERLFGSRLGG